MARTKPALTNTPAAPRAEKDGTPMDTSSPSARLAALLLQFDGGTEYMALIERLDVGGERTYMGRIPLTETLFDDVRNKWGGGRFTGRVVDSQKHYAGMVPTFSIDGPRRVEDVNAPAPAAVVATAQPSRTELLIVDTLGAIGRTLEQLAQRNAAAMDPTEQLVKLAGILQTVNGARPSSSGDPSETVGLIRELMGLQREMAEDRPAAPQQGIFGAALEGAVKPLVSVLNRKMALEEAKLSQRRVPSIPPALATNGRGVPVSNIDHPAPMAGTTSSSSSAGDVSPDPLVNLFRSIPFTARAFLVTCAADDDDPADYVSLVLNRLTDDAYEEIQKQLPRADFVAVLVREIPAAAEYRPWFTRLVEALRASLELTGRGSSEVEGGPGEGTAAHPATLEGGA